MIDSQAINLIKVASSFLLNQKNIAFFEEKNYEEGNSLLGAVGVDANTALGGIFSGDVKEVLVGGETGLGSIADAVSSSVWHNSFTNAESTSDSEVFKHPLEFNTALNRASDSARNYIADHSISLPQTFSCILVAPNFFYTSVFDEIEKLRRMKTPLVIVTRGKTFRNMVLKRYNKPLSVEKLSRMPVTLLFEEIQTIYPQEKKNANGDDVSNSQVIVDFDIKSIPTTQLLA